MKSLIALSLALGLLVGCSSNTPYVDKEYGQGTRKAFDAQVADPSYPHAMNVPTGIAGLPAEKIMKVYTDGFGKAPANQDLVNVNINEQGSSSSSK
jgi:hypothetical protein